MAIATASEKKIDNGKAANKAATKTAKGKEGKVVKKTTAKTEPKAATFKLTPKPTPKPRKGFFLHEDDVAKLRDEYKESKDIAAVIPHNSGAYKSFLCSLDLLGVNKAHSFKAVKAAMRDSMNAADTRDDNGKTLWQRFANRTSNVKHDEENEKSIDAKIIQNAEVLQRLGGETPYGLRLLQCGQLVLKTKGMVVDILRGKADERMFKLNTQSAMPLNEFKRARA